MIFWIARIGLAASAIMVAGAGPLKADVTITMASKSPAGDVTSTASIKGMKMREDSTVRGGIAAQFGAGSIENTRFVKLDERETINISSFEKKAIVQGKDYFDKVAKNGLRPDQPKSMSAPPARRARSPDRLAKSTMSRPAFPCRTSCRKRSPRCRKCSSPARS